MTYGQMLMVLLAAMLLSMLILNINKNTLITDASMNEYKIKEQAINVAQSIIDRAQNLKFDENPSTFTAPGSLGVGSEAGESASDPSTFDDFDDYNGYTNTASPDTIRIFSEQGKSIPPAVFKVKCSVRYVALSDLNTPVNNVTLYKRLEVDVSSDAYKNPYTGITDTVKLYTICGDWPNN